MSEWEDYTILDHFILLGKFTLYGLELMRDVKVELYLP